MGWIGRAAGQTLRELHAALGLLVPLISQLASRLERITETVTRLVERDTTSVQTLQTALEGERRAHAATREQLAALRSTLTWMTEHVNRLEQDRQALFAKVLDVQLPALEVRVTRRAEAEAASAPTPGAGPEGQDEYAETIPALQAAGVLFEDVGDEAARQLGIEHDELGNVRWRA
jgi:exonuclease VII large subunit